MTSGADPDVVAEVLQWDSELWGFRTARVVGEQLTAERADRLRAWCAQHDVRCVYFLAVPDDPATIAAAEAAGLHLTDVRMTLDQSIRDRAAEAPPSPPTATDPRLRLAAPGDVPALERIAAASYQDSRFYFDPGFPRETCDELYMTWIRKSCAGYADAVLVVDLDGEAVGFISCHLDDDGRTGRIGLVGVGEKARGQGVGHILVTGSLRWFAEHGAARVVVTTQGGTWLPSACTSGPAS